MCFSIKWASLVKIFIKGDFVSTITIEETLEYTKALKILYAEDDLELQIQTKEFFEALFDSVSVVNNGSEALELYTQEEFDIVISDIKMPTMDGLELAKKIKEINPQQCIIIISAYNNPQHLLEFINLNIRQFIKKPISTNNIIETLYYTSKMIVNENMVQEYRISLEKSNKELSQKNSELQSLVRILDSKLLQNPNKSEIEENKLNEIDATINIKSITELKELETDISGVAVLLSLSKHLNAENVQVLGALFISYANNLEGYKAYSLLECKIKELGESLNLQTQEFIDSVKDLSVLLESFIYVLRMWRGKVEHKEFHDASELHTSMINDIKTIISIISPTEKESEL